MYAPCELPQYPTSSVAIAHVLCIEDSSVHHRPILHGNDLLLCKHALERRVRISEPDDVCISLKHVDSEFNCHSGEIMLAQIIKVEGVSPVQLDA